MAHTYDTAVRFTGGSQLVQSFTTTAGVTAITLGIVTAGTTARSTGTPTFNGVSLLPVGTTPKLVSSETVSELWYLGSDGTPIDIGTYNIIVPNTGALALYCVAASFKGATAMSGFDNFATSNTTGKNPTCTITTLSNGCAIAVVLGTSANSWNPTAQQPTAMPAGAGNYDDGTFGDSGAYYLAGSSGNFPSSGNLYTFNTSSDYTIIMLSLKEAGTYPVGLGRIMSKFW